jgi:hypothetical protein
MLITDGDILSEFEKRAIEILKAEEKTFQSFKKERETIQSLMKSEDFLADLETVQSIINRYITEKKINPLYLLGYSKFDPIIGDIKIDGIEYPVGAELFRSCEGMNVVKKILDIIGIEYECKYCLRRPCCDVSEKIDECEGAKELFDNQFNYEIIQDILTLMVDPWRSYSWS